MSPLRSLLAATVLSVPGATAVADMTADDIRSGYQTHAALAQYYRWYQYYERPAGGIANALDILAEDVVITSGLGTANGHAEYEARVLQLPTTWRNAHHVKSVDVTHGDDGVTRVSAKIIYQNEGMLPDQAVRQGDLKYTITMTPGDTVLPLLASVLIEQESEPVADEFEDAYAANRVRSLAHYWLALIEDPARNAEPVREILAKDFVLNFSSGAITDFDGFAAWLAGPGSQVVASTHIMSNFAVEGQGDEAYRLTVDFDWAGILPNGSELVAKTRHTWDIENDVTERFARIKRMDVEVLEPFRPRAD